MEEKPTRPIRSLKTVLTCLSSQAQILTKPKWPNWRPKSQVLIFILFVLFHCCIHFHSCLLSFNIVVTARFNNKKYWGEIMKWWIWKWLKFETYLQTHYLGTQFSARTFWGSIPNISWLFITFYNLFFYFTHVNKPLTSDDWEYFCSSCTG